MKKDNKKNMLEFQKLPRRRQWFSNLDNVDISVVRKHSQNMKGVDDNYVTVASPVNKGTTLV